MPTPTEIIDWRMLNQAISLTKPSTSYESLSHGQPERHDGRVFGATLAAIRGSAPGVFEWSQLSYH